METALIAAVGSMLGGVITILGFEWKFLGLIKENYVKPLTDPMKDNMKRLEEMINKLEVVLEQAMKQITEFSKEMAILDQKVTALHSRVDDLDERLTIFAHFCSTEHKGDMSAETLAAITKARRR